MARTINHVTLLGRVGADPELRSTKNGTAVVQLRLATDRYSKSNGGQPETDWHTVVCWGKTAEAVARYVAKGAASTSAVGCSSTAGRPTPASAARRSKSTRTR